MSKKPVVIVGAGIAGLSAALAVWNHEIVILEKAKAFKEVGAGLQIGPNAVAALRALGAWEAVEPFTQSPPEIHMRDGITGRIVKRLRLGRSFEARFGAPYRTAHRADLHAALLQVVQQKADVRIHLQRQVTDILESGHILTDDGQEIAAAAVVGADGIHSPLRQRLFGGSKASDSGDRFYRQLISFRPDLPGVDLGCVNVWMVRGGHVVHYPVGARPVLNIVAITSHDTPLAEVYQRASPVLQNLLSHIEDSDPWPGLYVDGLGQWNKDNMVLIGDAAHGTLPYLAQGAAMALEDSAMLSHVLGQGLAFEQAFKRFSESRRRRAERLHKTSMSAGRTYHMSGPVALARNLALRAVPDSVMLQQLSWLYEGQNCC